MGKMAANGGEVCMLPNVKDGCQWGELCMLPNGKDGCQWGENLHAANGLLRRMRGARDACCKTKKCSRSLILSAVACRVICVPGSS